MNKKNISTIILIPAFLIFASLLFVWQGIYLPKKIGSGETIVFSIEKGEGSKEISLKLEKAGIIKWNVFFRAYSLFSDSAGSLKAGEYLFSPSMSIKEIIGKLVAGEVIRKKITIPEGWNMQDIGEYLEEKEIIKEEDFLALAGSALTEDFSQQFDFLDDKPKNLQLEGYLFPDTYEIVSGEGSREIILRILNNFGEKLTQDLRKEIFLQKKTVFQIVTAASLIEKEVKGLEDKKIVSGIIWKRLQAGMPLQIDATLNYITGKKNTKVSIADTQIDSPYNTYKYKGLPLGPISNPGMESILAAIYPEESAYWYYLSAKDGQTIFSKTLAEHNVAIAKYLK
jgi:UPF0755 protein